MMRIITGKARGTKLYSLEGNNTRPTAERTKEAIFSMIQFDIDQADVLDLFAGSGQMGLEALSRGAERATFVDNSKDAVNIIKKNVEKTHFEKGSVVIQSEFTDFIKRNRESRKYSLVFLDPPYASNFIVKALELLVDRDLLEDGATVVCESGDSELFCGNEELLAKFDSVKNVRYGIAHVNILKYRREIENNG